MGRRFPTQSHGDGGLALLLSNENHDMPFVGGNQLADNGPNKCSFLCNADGFQYIGLQARARFYALLLPPLPFPSLPSLPSSCPNHGALLVG